MEQASPAQSSPVQQARLGVYCNVLQCLWRYRGFWWMPVVEVVVGAQRPVEGRGGRGVVRKIF